MLPSLQILLDKFSDYYKSRARVEVARTRLIEKNLAPKSKRNLSGAECIIQGIGVKGVPFSKSTGT